MSTKEDFDDDDISFEGSEPSDDTEDDDLSIASSVGSLHAENIGQYGHVSLRLFKTQRMRKRWCKGSWAIYNDTTLYIFPTRAKFEDWYAVPSNESARRDNRVLTKINFSKEMESDSDILGYQVTDIKSMKFKGNLVYHFRLEQCNVDNVETVANFASESQDKAIDFQNVIKTCLSLCPDGGMRKT